MGGKKIAMLKIGFHFNETNVFLTSVGIVKSNSKTTKMLAILMANDDDDYDNNEDNKSAEKVNVSL